MRHEVVTMDFLEASVLVSEVAPFAIWAKLLTVELPAILRFVLVVKSCLRLGDSVDLSELFRAMSVLALQTIAAEADFCPVLAHFTLIFFGLSQRNHLTILQERHRGRRLIESGASSWGELPLLAHHWRWSSWNEG